MRCVTVRFVRSEHNEGVVAPAVDATTPINDATPVSVLRHVHLLCYVPSKPIPPQTANRTPQSSTAALWWYLGAGPGVGAGGGLTAAPLAACAPPRATCTPPPGVGSTRRLPFTLPAARFASAQVNFCAGRIHALDGVSNTRISLLGIQPCSELPVAPPNTKTRSPTATALWPRTDGPPPLLATSQPRCRPSPSATPGCPRAPSGVLLSSFPPLLLLKSPTQNAVVDDALNAVGAIGVGGDVCDCDACTQLLLPPLPLPRSPATAAISCRCAASRSSAYCTVHSA